MSIQVRTATAEESFTPFYRALRLARVRLMEIAAKMARDGDKDDAEAMRLVVDTRLSTIGVQRLIDRKDTP